MKMIENKKIRNTFSIEKNIPIFLYGENDFAKCTFSHLKQSGYDVKGIVDQKYENFCKEDEIRFSLRDLENWVKVKECIVIICLKNGMIHEKVASNLYDIGIRKIIYLPMKVCNSFRYQGTLRKAYRYVQAFEYEKVGQVPYYSIEENPVMVIERDDKWISFWCPDKYLHSSTKEIINEGVPDRLKAAKQKLMVYADVAIEEIIPYVELFKWLRGEKADVNLYLDAMGYTVEQERKKLLLDRKELYKIYEQALCYNIGFFLDAPAQAVWNTEGGYFNVVDGMHRIQYLYSKGYREMPIAVSLEDYRQFLKCMEDYEN